MTALAVEQRMLIDAELRPSRSGHAIEACEEPLRVKPIAGPA